LDRWPSAIEQPATTFELGDKSAVIPVAGDKTKLAFFEEYLMKPRPPAAGK
jgi:hypothetical protein